MKHLLDVNLLIAGIVQTHSRHALARDWLSGKQIVLCPIVEAVSQAVSCLSEGSDAGK